MIKIPSKMLLREGIKGENFESCSSLRMVGREREREKLKTKEKTV